MKKKPLVKRKRPGVVQDEYNPRWRQCELCNESMPYSFCRDHQCTHVGSTVKDHDGPFKVRDFSMCPIY